MILPRNNTFRRYNLIVEISLLLITLLLLLLSGWISLSDMNRKYLDLRVAEAAKVPMFLESHIANARQGLLAFAHAQGVEKSAGSNLNLLFELSDIYRLDKNLRITDIYKSSSNSRMFVGFSFIRGRLAGYLNDSEKGDANSRIVRGYEDDSPSIYFAVKLDNAGSDLLLARLNLAYIQNFLTRYAEFSGSPIYIVAPDGFVMMSASPKPELAISAFDLKKWAGEPSTTRILSVGSQSWIPKVSDTHTAGARLVTLIPTEMLDTQRRALLIFLGLLFSGLIALAIFKSFSLNKFVFQPIAVFVRRMQALEQGSDTMVDEKFVYRFEELSEIHTHFLDMAQAIREREQTIGEHAEQLRIANAQLEALANTDGLTGIANRRRFDEVLNTEFFRLRRSGSPLSLIILDVDHFKNFNDTYGHIAGDDCLRRVGALIDSTACRVSDLAARYGGEEFAVILPETDAVGATALAERLRVGIECLAIPHRTSKVVDHITVSLGVVTALPEDLESAVDIVKLTDKQLYAAKTRGRNRVEVFDVKTQH